MCSEIEKIRDCGIVPVIALDDAAAAVPVARALLAGGITVAEITFRTAAAEQAIANIAKEVPEMALGAGTVLNCEQAQRALDAGARFLVSPGFNPRVVEFALEQGALIVPGTSGPSEMEQAMSYGLTTVKFFPAEQSGGVGKLRAISAVYPELMVMPTGGIGENNLTEYLALKNVIACGGSWMVKKELIAAGNFAEITRLSEQAVRRALDFRLSRVLLYAGAADGASQVFRETLGLPLEFDSRQADVPGRLEVATLSLGRAGAFLKRKGVAFRTGDRELLLDNPIQGFEVAIFQA